MNNDVRRTLVSLIGNAHADILTDEGIREYVKAAIFYNGGGISSTFIKQVRHMRKYPLRWTVEKWRNVNGWNSTMNSSFDGQGPLATETSRTQAELQDEFILDGSYVPMEYTVFKAQLMSLGVDKPDLYCANPEEKDDTPVEKPKRVELLRAVKSFIKSGYPFVEGQVFCNGHQAHVQVSCSKHVNRDYGSVIDIPIMGTGIKPEFINGDIKSLATEDKKYSKCWLIRIHHQGVRYLATVIDKPGVQGILNPCLISREDNLGSHVPATIKFAIKHKTF